MADEYLDTAPTVGDLDRRLDLHKEALDELRCRMDKVEWRQDLKAAPSSSDAPNQTAGPVADSELRDRVAAALNEHGWAGGDHSNHPLEDFVDVVTTKLAPVLKAKDIELEQLRVLVDYRQDRLNELRAEVCAALGLKPDASDWGIVRWVGNTREALVEAVRERDKLRAERDEALLKLLVLKHDAMGQPDTEATEQAGRRAVELELKPSDLLSSNPPVPDPTGRLIDLDGVSVTPATPTEPRVWSFDDDEPDGVTTVTTPGGAEFNRGEDGRWHSEQVMHGYGFHWNDLVEGYPFVTEVVGDQAPGGEV